MDKKGDKNKLNNFLVQGGILAFTGVLVRMLGLAKRIPQAYIIGDIGNSYYSAAYEIYNIVYTIAVYGIPLSVSKLVSARVGKGEYKNAEKVFKCTLYFAIVIGLIASLFVFFMGNNLSKMLNEPMSYLALKVLAPTLFFACIMAVFRGYFQGLGSMIPTAISQLIEQVVLITVSLTAAHFLFGYGDKVGKILHNENYKYAYGAAGCTLGCAVGTLFALIFLILLYKSHSGSFKKKVYRDRTDVCEGSFDIFRILILTIIPVVISSFINNISNFLDQLIYNNMMGLKGLNDIKSVNWGIYSGKYLVLINVPIAIAASMGVSSVPTISNLSHRGEHKLVCERIKSVIRITMMIAIPCCVGLFVLAPSVMWCIFTENGDTASTLLRIGSAGVILFSFSTLTNSILQATDHLIKPILHGLIAIALHVTILLCLINFTNLNIYAVALSNNFFALFIGAMNLFSLRKLLNYRQEVAKTFVVPAISSAIMGIVIFILDKLFSINGYSRIRIICTIFIGAFVYFVSMLLLKGITRNELENVPGGSGLYRLLNRLHIMK